MENFKKLDNKKQNNKKQRYNSLPRPPGVMTNRPPPPPQGVWKKPIFDDIEIGGPSDYNPGNSKLDDDEYNKLVTFRCDALCDVVFDNSASTLISSRCMTAAPVRARY